MHTRITYTVNIVVWVVFLILKFRLCSHLSSMFFSTCNCHKLLNMRHMHIFLKVCHPCQRRLYYMLDPLHQDQKKCATNFWFSKNPWTKPSLWVSGGWVSGGFFSHSAHVTETEKLMIRSWRFFVFNKNISKFDSTC